MFKLGKGFNATEKSIREIIMDNVDPENVKDVCRTHFPLLVKNIVKKIVEYGLFICRLYLFVASLVWVLVEVEAEPFPFFSFQ